MAHRVYSRSRLNRKIIRLNPKPPNRKHLKRIQTATSQFKTMLLEPHLWTKNSSLSCWLSSPSRSAMKTKLSTLSPYWIPEVKLRSSSNMLRKLLNWKAQVAQHALVLSTEMIRKLMPQSYVSPSRQEVIRLYSIRPTLWLFRI